MIVHTDGPLQPAIKECEGVQEVEMESKEQCDNLKIVEQSALNHFNAILKKAQELGVEAEKIKSQKCPRKYDSKSKRMLKWQKKHQEDLEKQGYLLVFEFIAHVEEKNKKSTCMEQLVAWAAESEQASEESAPEEMDTEDSVSKHECMSQVHHRWKPSTH